MARLCPGGERFGQLGDGTHQSVSEKDVTDVEVSGLSGVTAIAASNSHALALLRDGEVVAWGIDQDGELGNGTGGVRGAKTAGLVPTVVPGLSHVLAIASGGASNFALLSNHTVMAWGKNLSGELGIGPDAEECETEVGEQPCSTRPRQVVYANGDAVTGVMAISGGGEATYALLEDGHVLAWGNDGKGQLGTGLGEDTRGNPPEEVKGVGGAGVLSGVVAVSGGSYDALALLDSGEVVGWGADSRGELGQKGSEECTQGTFCERTPKRIGGLRRSKPSRREQSTASR